MKSCTRFLIGCTINPPNSKKNPLKLKDFSGERKSTIQSPTPKAVGEILPTKKSSPLIKPASTQPAQRQITRDLDNLPDPDAETLESALGNFRQALRQ